MRLPAPVRVLLRRLRVATFRAAALLGASWAPRGKLSVRRGSAAPVAEALRGTADCSASFEVRPPDPQVRLAHAHGPPIATRAQATFNLVVDSVDPGYSFRNNMVVDHRRRVVAEERSSWDELPVSYSRLEPPNHIAGTVAYLSNTNVGNFYHWIVLTLPLLEHYRDRLAVRPDAYYVGRPCTDWHRESLAMIGIEESQIVTEAVRADRLVAVIANREHGAVDSSALAFVREELGRPRFSERSDRRLFIGRGDVAFRRFVNEEECFERLVRSYGFEYVTMDGKSVAEEIELFSSAQCIVGVHGAALTNLLWARSSCKVLELLPYGWNHPGYQEIAAFVGCEYAYVVGRDDAPRAAGPDKPDSVRRENDVLVDLDQVEAALRALGV